MADPTESKGWRSVAVIALVIGLVAFAGYRWQDAREDEQIDRIAEDLGELGTSDP